MPGAVLGAGTKGVNQVRGGEYYPGTRAACRRARKVTTPQWVRRDVKWAQERRINEVPRHGIGVTGGRPLRYGLWG